MPYTSLVTVNAGDIISPSAWGNQVKTNEDYLFSRRAGQVIKRDNNAGYTTVSNTFVDIDATNLIITATISSGKALIGFTGTLFANASGACNAGLDVAIDGTRYAAAGTDGILMVLI